MKKLFLTLSLTLLVATASFQAQIKKWMRPEKTISKDISLVIPSTDVYKSHVYAHSAATLNITVLKLKGGQADTLLAKEYPEIKLKNLPSYSQKFNERIHILNVVDSKEQIILTYNISYRNKKGSILKIENIKWVPKGIGESKVLITI